MIRNTCALFIAPLLTLVPAGAAQLPPEILADQLLLRIERMIETEETEGALEVVQEILAVQEDHAIQLPPEFHLRRAQVTFAAGLLSPRERRGDCLRPDRGGKRSALVFVTRTPGGSLWTSVRGSAYPKESTR